MAIRRTTRTTRVSRATNSDEIFVKVARTGGAVQEVCLNGDRTVKAALGAAGLDFSDTDRFKVKGATASLETILHDGDYVVVAGKIQGGLK
jgi:hypothetical protein